MWLQLRTQYLKFIMLSAFVGGFTFLSPTLHAQTEICDNGIDDDSDGLVDLNDEDCMCELINPISLIPNPSFEDMNCCPQERSELDCATAWIQASAPTTDFIHTCGWLGWNDFPPPMPFPDGDGIMGFRDGRVRGNGENQPFWKEYAGACLLSPLIAGQKYRFQFDVGFVTPERSPPINISFFGTADCVDLPFGRGNPAFGCPTNSPEWVRLGDVMVDGGTGNSWVNAVIEAVPDRDIAAIAIGPDCPAVHPDESIYYFFDNLLLANFETLELKVSETDHPCSNSFSLTAPNNPQFGYQWYYNGAALVGETEPELSNIYGEGAYQIRIDDGVSCRVSTNYDYKIPVFSEALKINICEGEQYQYGEQMLEESGMYLDTFSNVNGCDSIVALDLTVIGSQYDTLAASILKGETIDIQGQRFSEEGNYPITLMSELGCDSLVLIELTHFDIYFPNVISINSAQNNNFVPMSTPGNITDINLSIYNRWGNLIHEGPDWNGQDINGLAPPGVYVYKAKISMLFDLEKYFYGTVTVFD